jgi:RNA polymerase sigma factor (sigma-70 family)
MANRLNPSNSTKSLINKCNPLSEEEVRVWLEEYMRKKSQKAATALLNSVTKIFASEIYKNERKFLKTIPDATFDDIFNEMALMFLKGLSQNKFDPDKSKLDTWAYWAVMPLVRNPVRVMGSKFASSHTHVDINKPHGQDGGTIANVLPDTSVDLEKDYEAGEKHRELQKAISKLNRKDQEIIKSLFGFIPVKKDWQSKTGKINASSIARGEGVSPNLMRKRIADILQQLRKELK